ncbi:Dynactin subunit 3 [Thoreauomyces humboldtii]|nr:Dynactin subunit 3 [Thoreauomyces humboldtii]
MTDLDNDKGVSQLDERLAHLEALTAPSLLSVANPGREELQGSLLRSLQGVQEKLLRFTEERRAIGDFLQRYGQLRELLRNDPDELEGITLDTVAKRDILLASEEDLVYHAAELKRVSTLKAELDSPILQALESQIPALAKIEALNVRQRHTEASVRERLSHTLVSYNNLVDCLSEMFICYEELLSDLEMKVLSCEQQLA